MFSKMNIHQFVLNWGTFFFLYREYGEILVSCGMIGEALKIFEDLELWDNLIFCYRYHIDYALFL